MKENESGRNVLEERTKNIVNRQVRIDELDLDKEFDFMAAIAALNRDHKLVRNLNVMSVFHERLLCEWIRGDYTKFATVPPAQYTDKILNVFLAACLAKTKAKRPAEMLEQNAELFYGFDGKPVIDVIYKTCDGEEIRYFDKELQIPARLISKLRVRFKVENAKSFLTHLDVRASSVNFSFIVTELNRKIADIYRDVVLDVLAEEEANYYSLSKYYNEIAKNVKEKLSAELEGWGVVIKEASLNQIEMPSNASAVLESQFFKIRKETRQKQFEQEMAEASLKNYERKAEIHSKYPDFELTLTEAEKDYALNRYLKKVGSYQESVTGLILEPLSEREDGVSLNNLKTKPVKPVPPVEFKRSKAFGVYISLLLICLVLGIIVTCEASVMVGCFILAATVLVFGMYAAFMYMDLKKSFEKPQYSEEYEKQFAIYEAEMAEYEKSMKN